MQEKRCFFIIIIIIILTSLCGFCQEVKYPFADAIRQFKENDKANPPPQHAILFAGSSSFTMWRDVQEYFPGFTIINRGFGGSTIPDQILYADSIIFPYAPGQIVIYCGENDLASCDTVSPEIVTGSFINLFQLIRSKLPGVKITYVSMKPSPSRWQLAEKIQCANRNIRKFIHSQTNAGFVNIWNKMLNGKHLPDTTLFIGDRLHMNAKGYAIWQKAIKPELIK